MRKPAEHLIEPAIRTRIRGLLLLSMRRTCSRRRSESGSGRSRLQRRTTVVSTIPVVDLRIVRAGPLRARSLGVMGTRALVWVVDPFRRTMAVCSEGMDWRWAFGIGSRTYGTETVVGGYGGILSHCWLLKGTLIEGMDRRHELGLVGAVSTVHYSQWLAC